MSRARLAAVFIAFASSLAGGASAQGWLWLHESPVVGFSENDWDAWSAEIQRVLGNEPDGSTTTWTSTETDSSSDLTPVRTSRRGEQTCRRLRMVIRSRGRQSTNTQRFCEQPDGEWKIVP